MYEIKVNDMACAHCADRIKKGLDAAGLDNVVSLEDKTVKINGCEKCVSKAMAVLDDLGFEEVSMK